MVDLYGYDHVYVCAPPVSFNKDKTVKVHLCIAPLVEIEQQGRIEALLEPEMKSQKSHEFIASKVKKIEELKVGGVEVTSYEQLRKTGPNELLRWIQMAVFSEQLLSEAEIKN